VSTDGLLCRPTGPSFNIFVVVVYLYRTRVKVCFKQGNRVFLCPLTLSHQQSVSHHDTTSICPAAVCTINSHAHDRTSVFIGCTGCVEVGTNGLSALLQQHLTLRLFNVTEIVHYCFSASVVSLIEFLHIRTYL